MLKKTSLLLYEKQKKLNLILEEQLFKTGLYDIHTTVNQTRVKVLLDSLKPNILILNFDDLSSELSNTVQNFKDENNYSQIIGYHNKHLTGFKISNSEIKLLSKPFKIITLLEEVRKMINSKCLLTNDILITDHLKFIYSKRILYSLKTKQKEHLTEKENDLLLYFYNHKDIEINKIELLNQIWGFTESIETHTLETHIYRLKLKLRRLEPNLPFTLSNKKGLCIMRFNKTI